MLKEGIVDVSEMPRADQIDYIKQVQKLPSTSYQQVVSEIDMMPSYLQYFAADLDADGNCIHDEDQPVLLEDDYWKVLLKLAPMAWYGQLAVDGKNTKNMILSEIKQIFRWIEHEEKYMEA
eukprot:1518201-Ditylum_brightwellii.AAC.1